MTSLTVTDLTEQRCVAIARGRRATHCADTAQALSEAGIGILEFPLTTPDVLAALPELIVAAGPDAFVGVGSVVTPADGEAAVEAGARFLVTPVVDVEVIRFAVGAGVPILAGAYTPTEIQLAWQTGATAVKLFPAVAGGPGLVRQLISGPFPGTPLVPTGGVTLEDAGHYIRSGAVALGMGGALLGDVLETGSFGPLRERIARFQAVLAEAA